MEKEYKTNLIKRSITAMAIIASIILIILLQNFWVFSIMISLICILAFHEWIKNNFESRYYSGLSLIFLFWFSSIYFVFYFSSSLDSFPTPFKITFDTLSIYGIFLIIIFNTAIFDTFAYIIGSNFGKNFITPKISPNKTISGSIGSFIFSIFLIPFFYKNQINENLLSIFLITITISATSQLGDLFISLLKRKAKVKDTGDLLPGHGGILDRIDGIIFAIPLGIYLFIVI